MNKQEPQLQFFSYFVQPGFWIEDIPVTPDEVQSIMNFFNCAVQNSLALPLKAAGDVSCIYLSRASIATAMVSKNPMGEGQKEQHGDEEPTQAAYEINTQTRRPDPRTRDPYGLKA